MEWWENVAVLGSWLLMALALAAGAMAQTTVRIAGRVTDVTRAPVANVGVELKAAGASETISKARTDQDGRFVFPAAPPRDYELHFQASGFSPLVKSIAAAGDIELTNIVLELGPLILIGSDVELPNYMAPVHKLLEGAVEPIHTTLCEIAQAPEDFIGKIVVFRAQYVSKFQWIGLKYDRCSASIRLDGYDPLDGLRDGEYAFTRSGDDLSHPERLKWRPVTRRPPIVWIKDQGYSQIQKYAGAKFRWPDGGVCLDCPLYRITATFTGRFEYFETQTIVFRTRAGEQPQLSSGDPNAPLLRMSLRSASDVEVKPIDPAEYPASKRVVSNQEAHELVHTYLGREEKECPLEAFHDPHYPEFVGFQALSNRGGSIGYFLINPRTGDLWNGVICERLSSPALEKLQRIIRRRIGLSEDAYRRTQTEGPMCEPGMPRVSSPK